MRDESLSPVLRRHPPARSLTPPLEDYVKRLQPVWESRRFTNQGPCVRELEEMLAGVLDTPRGLAVANGTLALQPPRTPACMPVLLSCVDYIRT